MINDYSNWSVEVYTVLKPSLITSIFRLLTIMVSPIDLKRKNKLTGINANVYINFINTIERPYQKIEFPVLVSTRDSLFHRHDMTHGMSGTPPILNNNFGNLAELLDTAFYIAADIHFEELCTEKTKVDLISGEFSGKIAKGDFYTTLEDDINTVGILVRHLDKLVLTYYNSLKDYSDLLMTILSSNWSFNQSYAMYSINGIAEESYGVCLTSKAFQEIIKIHNNALLELNNFEDEYQGIYPESPTEYIPKTYNEFIGSVKIKEKSNLIYKIIFEIIKKIKSMLINCFACLTGIRN